MKRFLFLGLCLVSALFSCAKKNANQSENQGVAPFSIPVRSVQDALERMLSVDIECPKEGCNSSVGLLVSVSEGTSEAYQCTTTLVDKNTIVTNSHCVPDDIKANPKLCKTRMKAVFPLANGEEEIRNCDEILGFSSLDDNMERVDLALLRLQPGRDRDFISWKRTGANQNDSVKLLKIEPRSDGYLGGTFNPQNCTLRPGSWLVPEFKDRNSHLLFYTDCKVNPGNSGSALLDTTDGKIFGLAYGHIIPEDLNRIYEKNQEYLLEDTTIPNANLGTNLYCIDALDGKFRTDCTKAKQKEVEFTVSISKMFADTSITENLEKERKEILSAVNAEFPKFRLHSQPVEQISATLLRESVMVDCVNSREITSDSPRELSFAIPVPELRTRWGLNSYLQPRLKIVSQGESTLEFSAQKAGSDTWKILMNGQSGIVEPCTN